MPTLSATAESDSYQQWLKSLRSIPEFEAAKALREALLKGTRPGGVTFTRADYHQFYEHVHHYYGCPEDIPCDIDSQEHPLSWEEDMLVPIDFITEKSLPTAMQICLAWLHIGLWISEFGALIRERWLKKSVLQRKATLLTAHPELPLKHRPDIDCCLLETCPHQRRSAGMVHYAFPHLNIEDLTKPNSLLILLDARSRNPPSKFAYSDLELAPLLKLRPALLEATDYTMSFNHYEYGLVREWSKKEDATTAIAKGVAVHPAQGFQILRMQLTLSLFLLKCIHEIVPDKIKEIEALRPPLNQGLEQAYARVVKSANGVGQVLPPHLGESSYSSLNVIAREACYRVPMLSDLGRLQALVKAGRNAAEDHIWFLREDPGYFAEAMTENKEHRPELLPGITCGVAHKNSQDDTLWPRVLRDGVTDCYVDLFVWDEIHRRISRLNQLAKQYADYLGKDQLGSRVRLPKDFSQCLTEAWFFLEAIQLDLIQQLKLGWPSSLEIRAYFAQECNSNCEDLVGVKFMNKGSRKRDKELDHIFKLFQYLWEFPVRQTLKVHVLVDALENLLQTNPRARFLTSPWVASLLSKLSVVTECLRQLNFFQPWAKRIAYNVKRRQTKLLIAHCLNFSKWNCILKTSFEGTELVELGKPGGSKFRYPVKKRRNQATVDVMRASEAALDAFWNAADARFKEHTGTTPHEIVHNIIEERTLQRTPPWIEPSKYVSIVKPIDYIYIPFSNALHDPNKQITGTFEKLAVSTKKRIRCKEVTPFADGDDDDQELGGNEDQQTFLVDKRAHKVFRILFYAPSSRDNPGDIPWQDFLYAMVSVGFAVEKLQGSAWQFTPKNLDVEQPIQFHEPHPTHKLPFTWARRNGRRLFKNYGWTSDMFRLAR